MVSKLFKGFLKRWLRERALRLPEEDVTAIAKRLGVKRELVVAVNDAIIEWVIKHLD